ncbi:AAA-ATPase At2g18193-like [Mercurialis annua]|uniref:AAA-ATPase At2g18193-like n=1 Tax=Mercurialis annua TaxID=3986 RepID=UPI0021607B12|nr:AAA-ATPase At2g18193-like [Mercurialis annua]
MEDYYSKHIPSNVSLLSAYSSISTSWVLLKTAYSQIIPRRLQDYVISKLKNYFSYKPSYTHFIIYETWDGQGRNELYDASQAYVSTIIGPKNQKLKVGKLEQKKNVSIAIAGGGEVEDTFRGIHITWYCVKEKDKNSNGDSSGREGAKKSPYWIVFDSQYMEIIKKDYLDHILKNYNALKAKEKVLKLYTRFSNYQGGSWNAVEFHHPSTFDTLAMDPEQKKRIIDDLDRFMGKKEFYKGVGKAWKRGYLLYGPPGTGKSSLIAAMANYLNFNVFELELSSVCSDVELRKLLLHTTNRSILIIEDIDCNSEVHDRSNNESENKFTRTFTLSTLLNCVDGLWSSCGEARIIVFTTNHKDIIDPALLRPGRMDMHINMSYCTTKAFRVLAYNYLGVHHHKLFDEIDALIESVNVTPACLAEELMKSDDADAALGEVLTFLKSAKSEENENQKTI